MALKQTFDNLAQAASSFGRATATFAGQTINNVRQRFSMGQGNQNPNTMNSPFSPTQPNQTAQPVNQTQPSPQANQNQALIQAIKELTTTIKQSQGKGGAKTPESFLQKAAGIADRGISNIAAGGVAAANATRGLMNIGSQTTAAGLLNQVPLVGGMLAAPYQILSGKAGNVGSLEQLNRQVQFGAGNFRGGFVRQSNPDLARFAAMGIGPAEAMSMQMQAQEAGLGRFMPQNLSAFARFGLSGTTAGLVQGIGNTNLNKNAINGGGILNLLNNMGFGNNSIQSMMQTIRGIQSNTTLNLGAGLLNQQSMNNLFANGIGRFGADTGGVISKIFGASQNIGMSNFYNPYSGLVGLGIRNEALRRGKGDVFETARAQEKIAADPLEMVRVALAQSGGNEKKARELLVGESGLTTGQVELLLDAEKTGKKFGDLLQNQKNVDILAENAGALGAVAGVQVSKKQAQYDLADTSLGGKIANALKENREVEQQLLKNQNDDTKQILDLMKGIAVAAGIVAAVITDIYAAILDFAKKYDVKGLYDKGMTKVGEAANAIEDYADIVYDLGASGIAKIKKVFDKK